MWRWFMKNREMPRIGLVKEAGGKEQRLSADRIYGRSCQL